MYKLSTRLVLALIFLLSLANLVVGWVTSHASFTAAGGGGICYVLLRLAALRRRQSKRQRCASSNSVPPRPVAAVVKHPAVDPGDTEGLVAQMLAQGRSALLLRAQIAATLTRTQFARALKTLEETMGLVPEGEVVLGQIDEALEDGRLDEEEITQSRARVVRVEAFFLDRYPVTNRQFYEFVAAGAYQQVSLWDRSIWPAVLDWVDRTGVPGPRYWQDGCFPEGEENLPVVGINWFEASAYARWVGKRLPTDAEWVKAGSWPVPLSATSRIQRSYPWGETMDRRRANIWGSGPERIVAVDAFAEGVSVGGVYQLIGNVWEWTSGNFRSLYHHPSELLLPAPLKSIRGGAFDTYFDNQATCQFSSGENPLSRRHNIGFRCAVGVCDLTLAYQESEAVSETPDQDDDQPRDPQAQFEEVHA